MKYYSYVIPRDYGFAPNPYFNCCTLATCKPKIRKTAQIGDWIAAYGSASTKYKSKLVMIMRVDEVLSFDQYWEDVRFRKKRPIFNRSVDCKYGDNIYHYVGDKWFQEFSHHSFSDGSTNYKNLNRDTGVNRVLIANEFYYFGNNAIEIPDKFSILIKNGIGHSIIKNEKTILDFIQYLKENYDIGIHGIPYSRKSGEFAHYKGE